MPITQTGSSELAAMLDQQARRVRDPRAFLESERAALQGILDGSFAADRSPDGEPWAPRVNASRDARTGRSRPRHDGRPGRQLLERTGRLLRSEVVRVGRSGIEAFNEAPYAGFVQRGTRSMRARGILPTSDGGGAAGAWLAGFGDRLARFITTGSL